MSEKNSDSLAKHFDEIAKLAHAKSVEISNARIASARTAIGAPIIAGTFSAYNNDMFIQVATCIAIGLYCGSALRYDRKMHAIQSIDVHTMKIANDLSALMLDPKVKATPKFYSYNGLRKLAIKSFQQSNGKLRVKPDSTVNYLRKNTAYAIIYVGTVIALANSVPEDKRNYKSVKEFTIGLFDKINEIIHLDNSNKMINASPKIDELKR